MKKRAGNLPPAKLRKSKAGEEKVEVYPDEEQGILPEKTPDEKKAGIMHGEEDEDIYEEEGREVQVDEDEIEPWEEGFMEGAAGPGQLGKDALTGEPLRDVEDVVEAEIGGKIYRFASEENARKFREKKGKERKG